MVENWRSHYSVKLGNTPWKEGYFCMITQKNNKKSIRKKNLIRAAEIKYLLKKKGLKSKDIVRDLNITSSAVSRAINGLSKIRAVDDWLIKNIGTSIQNTPDI